MKLQILTLIIGLLLVSPLKSQHKIRVIRANKPVAFIQINHKTVVSKWNVTPRLRPDEFTTNILRARVSFITDLDSFTCVVKPGKPFDFVVLAQGKDSAFTRISFEVSPYLKVLQQAGVYDIHEKVSQNPYQGYNPSAPDLVRLKNTFHLDSVAGKGTEVSKLVHLMLWLNKSVIYDGSKEVPAATSITALLERTIQEKGTFHCGVMANTMEQIFRSMGYNARRIVCFPKDSNDFECHSIVTVYAPSVHKWLYMDPVHGAYFTDKRGNLLSIAEVREFLVDNKKIKLNPEANLNGEPEHINNYLYVYMAKNLYAFKCFSAAEGNSISNVLLPTDYIGEFTHTRGDHPKVTHNPLVFWGNLDLVP